MKLLKNKKFLRYYFTLTLPIVFQQMLINLVGVCDTLMISAIGENAISAVTVANKFFFIFSLAIFGLSNGIGLYISQFYGANDKANYNRIFRYGNLLCIILGVIVTIFLFIYPEITMSLFVKNNEIIKLGLKYIDFVKWSYIPFAISNMYSVAFRILEKPNIPLLAGVISFITNIILNYILIMGNFGFPKMGIAGAALATCISRYIEMLVLLIIGNNTNSEIRLNICYGKLANNLKKDIITKAFPLMCNEIMFSLGLSIVFLNFSFINEKAIPALTVADNINSLIYVIFSGSGVAIGLMVGSELGANHISKAKENAKNMIILSVFTYAFGGSIILLTSRVTPLAFSLQDESLNLAAMLLIIKSFLAWTQSYSNTIYYILRAGGDTKSVLIIDGLFTWFGPVLTSVVFSRIFTLDFLRLYVAVESMGIIKVCIATYFYKKEKWICNLTSKKDIKINVID